MSEDLIRRSDAIKAVQRTDVGGIRLEDVCAVTDAVTDAINAIPTIEPKRGEWVECDVNDTSGYWKCSACGRSTAAIVARTFYNFCPYCGARMKGADDE